MEDGSILPWMPKSYTKSKTMRYKSKCYSINLAWHTFCLMLTCYMYSIYLMFVWLQKLMYCFIIYTLSYKTKSIVFTLSRKVFYQLDSVTLDTGYINHISRLPPGKPPLWNSPLAQKRFCYVQLPFLYLIFSWLSFLHHHYSSVLT